MVMRNRHDGANAPQWWDDLPPEIKKRCANSPHLKNQDNPETSSEPPSDWFENPSQSPVKVRRDLSWLALIFVCIAFTNLLFLFVALWFLNGRGLFGG
jgi:hypothetical protein